MVFSSTLFLFGFLPLFLTAYYACPVRGRNYVALAGSLGFYAWGAPAFVIVLVVSGLMDYWLSQRIAAVEDQRRRRQWLVVGLILNVGLLGYFKYANFFVAEFNGIVAGFGFDAPIWTQVALPIGISFFTFQKISYLVDVYRLTVAPARSASDYTLYISLFPQLIAGPIVRYRDIHDQINGRVHRPEKFLSGIQRFAVGLGKKVLIADALATVVDPIFAMPVGELPTLYAWVGAVCYSLQIYFDFSGYSDMAIGLGRMMGFEFRENFDRPYLSASITEFWQRWHISLSRWMREYIYIPLGGNRVSTGRAFLNLWIVFLISGFWHGAAWSFVVWGAYHGALLTLERLRIWRRIEVPRLIRRGLVLLLVMFGWILFRADGLDHALLMMGRLFVPGPSPIESAAVLEVAFSNRFVFVVIAAIGIAAYPWVSALQQLEKRFLSSKTVLVESIQMAALLFLFGVTVLTLADATHNPFIYFRF